MEVTGIIEFLTVYKHKSFSNAARELGVSVSHISRRIASLEEKVGVSLFKRTTRKISPTPQGKHFYEECMPLMAGLESAFKNIQIGNEEMSGKIKIATAGDFVAQVVTPILAEFLRDYPEIDIELDFNYKNIDIIESEYDFALRFGLMTDSSLIARKVTDRKFCVVASPKYLEQNGVPKTLEDLKKHNCLVGYSKEWLFKDGRKRVHFKPKGNWRSNNVWSTAQAAVSGLGIGYLPFYAAESFLLNGKVVRVLDNYVTDEYGTWIIYPSKKNLPHRVRQLIDRILDRTRYMRI